MLKKLINKFLKFSRKRKILALFVFTLIFRSSYGFYANSFTQDVARDLVLTEDRIEREEWLVGYGPKASVGDFYLPPFYYQAHTILSALTNNHPFVMKFFVIVLESATPIILLFMLELLGFGGISWALALLYVLAPTPTIFGSVAWNPNTIPFFATLALFSWLRIIGDKNKNKFYWEPVVGTLALTIAAHLHYQVAVIIPFALGVAIWSFWKQPRSRNFWLLGIVLSLLTLLPYAMAELKNNWQNTQAVVDYFTGEHSRYYERVSKPTYVLTFLPSFLERTLTGDNFRLKFLGRILFFIGGLTMFTTAFKKRKKQPLHLWLGVYLLSVVLMLRVYKGDKIDYYLSTLYFFPTVLFAYLWKKYKRLTYLLLIFSLFNIGLFYGKTNRMSAYSELKMASEFIHQETEDKEARYIFHDDNDINTFAYGLSRSGEIKINQESLLVVDVCQPQTECIWKGLPRCNYSRDYTYAAILKSTGDYLGKKQFIADSGMIILVGEFRQQPQDFNYPLYLNDLSYGSDTLYPELYE